MLTLNLLPTVAAVTAGGSSSTLAARGYLLGRIFAWLALAALSFPAHPLAAPIPFAQADPTAEEQDLLQKLNRARMDPTGEGQRLAAWLRNTAEGQAVVRSYGTNPAQVAADFAALPAVPPLAFDPHLLAAARAHSADLAAHGGLGPGAVTSEDNGHVGPDGVTLIGHYGYDGSTPGSRVAASGFAGNFAGENAAPMALNTDDIHAGYLVDWGNPGLGHRRNAMAAAGTNFVGIGLATLSGPYPLVETEDFGSLVHYDYILSTHLVPYNGQMISVPY